MPLPETVLPDTARVASEILKFYDSLGNSLPRLYVFYNATGFRVFCRVYFFRIKLGCLGSR